MLPGIPRPSSVAFACLILIVGGSTLLPDARSGPGHGRGDSEGSGHRSAGQEKHDQKSGRKSGENSKPKLTLTAEPAVGFAPLVVIMTGHLTKVDLRDPNFCHAAVTWIRIAPGQTEDRGFRIREDPACLHPAEDVSVETAFTRTFYLSNPGSYLVRLIVEGRDGTRIHSGLTTVQVLRVQ